MTTQPQPHHDPLTAALALSGGGSGISGGTGNLFDFDFNNPADRPGNRSALSFMDALKPTLTTRPLRELLPGYQTGRRFEEEKQVVETTTDTTTEPEIRTLVMGVHPVCDSDIPDDKYVRGRCPDCGDYLVSHMYSVKSSPEEIGNLIMRWECWASLRPNATCHYFHVL